MNDNTTDTEKLVLPFEASEGQDAPSEAPKDKAVEPANS